MYPSGPIAQGVRAFDACLAEHIGCFGDGARVRVDVLPEGRWGMSAGFGESADSGIGLEISACTDVPVRVLFGGFDALGTDMVGLELVELTPQILTDTERSISPKVDEGVVFLLGHVIAVGPTGLPHPAPPL